MSSDVKRFDTEQVRAIYDTKARTWKWMVIPEALFGLTTLRLLHFSQVSGEVLDIGCGTGENFKYLGGADAVAAVDLSPQMLEKARARARRMGIEVDFHQADAAELPFPDNRFNHVISAMSTCTFPDYISALQEMARVTKPGGRIWLLEHGRSRVGWISRRQDRAVDRIFEATACRSNRDPVAEIEEAGLAVSSMERSHLGMAYRIVIEVT